MLLGGSACFDASLISVAAAASEHCTAARSNVASQMVRVERALAESVSDAEIRSGLTLLKAALQAGLQCQNGQVELSQPGVTGVTPSGPASPQRPSPAELYERLGKTHTYVPTPSRPQKQAVVEDDNQAAIQRISYQLSSPRIDLEAVRQILSALRASYR
ncbi:hypothetical protein [Bradyrhizobium sp. ORS 375]|uniref:hypothetical protein n=1 Tax=Bradyrhizobium sp. (strain ORS 375) TaxID=566679 RepID=UPI00111265B7|nr:hypothetical protein [Bradyrhizobium sp. ORS 375]